METNITQSTIPHTGIVPAIGIPPLESGDVLSRDEFERRYEAMPNVKAELIEGVVYVSSPVNFKRHGQPESDLGIWLGYYRWKTPGVSSGHNSTVRLSEDSEPQPDLLLCIDPDCGGQTRLNDGTLEGAPELVAEIAASRVSIDLNAKFRNYRQNSVQEYLVWRVNDRVIDWFHLKGDQYVPLPPDSNGVLRSIVFPGLWLDMPGMLRGDTAVVEDCLRAGLADPTHQAFVAKLAAKRKKS
jgi:hypothetical protein